MSHSRLFERALLVFITPTDVEPNRIVELARAACEGGVDVVQLRRPGAGGRELFEIGERLRDATRAYRRLLLINDRIDVALAVGADGVHLPAAGMDSLRARTLLGRSRILGRSVHTGEEIARERAVGVVDYLQFGPVFATPSKVRFGPPQGLRALSAAVEAAAPVPVVAVGGICEQTVAGVLEAGAGGVAVIRAIADAADVRAAAGGIAEAIERCRLTRASLRARRRDG